MLNLNAPPESGEIVFELASFSEAGVSYAPEVLANYVRGIVSPLNYFLDGDVAIQIRWSLQERQRWEAKDPADIEQVLQGVFGGMCGKDGIIFDECQVQHTAVSWIYWACADQKVQIQIKFNSDEFIYKPGLVFVQLQDSLCFPVPLPIQQKGLSMWLDVLERSLRAREDSVLVEAGPSRVMPVRFIHCSRIKDFPVHGLAELRKCS
jgi:hypothetical protein